MPTAELRVYTVNETAQLLRIGRATAYLAIQRGQIPSLRVGGRILVPAEALAALLRTGGQK